MPNGKVWRAAAISSLAMLAFAGITIIVIYFYSSTTIVLLVRHGNRDTTPVCQDALGGPQLNTAGNTRAAELSHMGEDTGIQSIYASEYCRTQQTVAPISGRIGVPITVVNQYAADHVTPDVGNLVSQIRGSINQTILVAGHSDTVPRIIEGLGGETVTIGDTEFDNLYVVTIHRWWFIRNVKVVRLKYGATT